MRLPDPIQASQQERERCSMIETANEPERKAEHLGELVRVHAEEAYRHGRQRTALWFYLGSAIAEAEYELHGASDRLQLTGAGIVDVNLYKAWGVSPERVWNLEREEAREFTQGLTRGAADVIEARGSFGEGAGT